MIAVVQSSLVIKDRFEQLANEASAAYNCAVTYGPFDVVNLDLCSSISPLRLGELNYYAALSSLSKLQVRCRAGDEPWLLLVTSRTGGPWVNRNDMKKLAACVSENVESYSDFRNSLEQLVPGGYKLAKSSGTDWSKIDQSQFLNLFSVGFGKWLLKLLSSAEPRWSAKLLESYSYRVAASEPDMVSLAFLIQAHIQHPVDTTGLSSARHSTIQHSYDEMPLALDLLKGVRDIEDIDAKLRSDKKLYEMMEKETVKLLLEARYDRDTVRSGMAKFRQKLN